MIKSLREKIIEILEKIDDIHTDGYLMKNYQEKLADQILELFEEEKQKWVEEIEKECREHIACNKLGNTSKGEWVIGFHQGLHWVRNLLKPSNKDLKKVGKNKLKTI